MVTPEPSIRIPTQAVPSNRQQQGESQSYQTVIRAACLRHSNSGNKKILGQVANPKNTPVQYAGCNWRARFRKQLTGGWNPTVRLSTKKTSQDGSNIQYTSMVETESPLSSNICKYFSRHRATLWVHVLILAPTGKGFPPIGISAIVSAKLLEEMSTGYISSGGQNIDPTNKLWGCWHRKASYAS